MTKENGMNRIVERFTYAVIVHNEFLNHNTKT